MNRLYYSVCTPWGILQHETAAGWALLMAALQHISNLAGMRMAHLVAKGDHACARQRGNVHYGLNVTLLLGIPECVCQRQTTLCVCVVHLQKTI